MKKILLYLFLLEFIFSISPYPEAISFANAGSVVYSDLRSINPSSLAFHEGLMINIIGVGFGFGNNFLAISDYNDINGANLDDPTDANYYPKDDLEALIDDDGIRINVLSFLNTPLMNIAYRNISFTSTTHSMIDAGIPKTFMSLVLNGNELGRQYDIDLMSSLVIFSEQALTYAQKYKDLSFGIRFKYLQGLVYGSFSNVTGLSSYFTTDSIAFSGKGEFLLEQAIGGSGYAVDFGISNVKPIRGWKLGITLNNLFGKIYWDDSNITYDLLYDNISEFIPLRHNESQYISMNLDSVNALNMMNMDADEIFYIENFPVVVLDEENIPDNILENGEFIITGNGTYLVNSENLENDFLKTLEPLEQVTTYPTLLSFGANKLIKDDIEGQLKDSKLFTKRPVRIPTSSLYSRTNYL